MRRTGQAAWAWRAFFGIYAVAGTIAVLEPPHALPLGIGFDPSWTLGLAEAARRHLVFGRDIVFAYGPLGHLIVPIATQSTYAAMVALQIGLGGLVLAAVAYRLRDATSIFQRILLAAFAVPLVAGSSLEMWPAFALLLLITRASPARFDLFGALVAGAVCGACVLMKVTIAFDLLLIVAVFVAARVWEARYDRAMLVRLSESTCVFVSGMLGFSAVEFFARDYGATVAVAVELAVFGSALLAGAHAAWRPRSAEAKLQLGLCAASLAIGLAAATGSHAYLAYLYGLVQIGAGYSSAMALAGPFWQLEAALILLVALAVTALSRAGLAASAGLALLAFAWAVFKHGFVRQDSHVLMFFGAASFVALTLLYSQRRRSAALLAGVVFATSIALDANARAALGSGNVLQSLAPQRLLANVHTLARLDLAANRLGAANQTALASDALPPALRHELGSRPVDVVPSETAFAFASKLRWDPEPDFQSASTYTSALDRMNAASLSHRRGDAILYTLGSIDDRYPIGDEPLTFRYVLCNYEPARGLPAAWGAADGSPHPGVVVLVHARSSRCSPHSEMLVVPSAWEQVTDVPWAPGWLTFAHISTPLNPLGMALALAYRAPQVRITVASSDTTPRDYSLIAGTARDGLLVDPLPRNDLQARALFEGRPFAHTTSITLSASNRLLFGAPEIVFERVRRTLVAGR